MTAPSKSWTNIADSAVDPDSPLDTALLTAIRDNLAHLEEWLGHSYTAAQDHNHDGTNSALIEVGPSLKRNGSFESDLVGWTATQYTGGTVAAISSDQGDGLKALAVTSTSTVNGGGDVIGAEYIAVSGTTEYAARWVSWAGAANISAKLELVWYDSAKSQISATTLWNTTDTGTGKTQHGAVAYSPANARWCRPKFTGGVPGSGSAFGTVYFDGFAMGLCFERIARPGSVVTAQSLSGAVTASVSPAKVKEIQVPYAGVVTVSFDLNIAGATGAGRIYVNGSAVGTNRTANGTYTEDIAVAAHDLLQVYGAATGGDTTISNLKIKTAWADGYVVNL